MFSRASPRLLSCSGSQQGGTVFCSDEGYSRINERLTSETIVASVLD